jgi:hypothetical protein
MAVHSPNRCAAQLTQSSLSIVLRPVSRLECCKVQGPKFIQPITVTLLACCDQDSVFVINRLHICRPPQTQGNGLPATTFNNAQCLIIWHAIDIIHSE